MSKQLRSISRNRDDESCSDSVSKKKRNTIFSVNHMVADDLVGMQRSSGIHIIVAEQIPTEYSGLNTRRFKNNAQ